MEIVRSFIFSAIAVIGFAGYFNIKKKNTLYATALSGAISFAVLNIFLYFGYDMFGVFLAALLVGLLGELFSVRLKTPSTVFITPAIIPLVPGAGMYYTMFNFVNGNFQEMVSVGSTTFLTAGSIAIGILISSIFSRSLKRMRRYNIK